MYKNRWYNQGGVAEETDDREIDTPASDEDLEGGDAPVTAPQTCEELAEYNLTNDSAEADMAVLCTACADGTPPEGAEALCECCADDQPLINWSDALGNVLSGSDEVASSDETYLEAMTDTKECWRCDGESVVFDSYDYPRGEDFTCPEGSSGSLLAPGYNPCAKDEGMMAGFDAQKVVLIAVGLGLAYYLYSSANAGIPAPTGTAV